MNPRTSPPALAAILAAALAAAGCSDDGTGPAPEPGPGYAPLPATAAGQPWHARQVHYAVDVRSFQDSDGDGVGDLAGLRSRLPELRSLGAGVLVLGQIQPGSYADGPRAASSLDAVDPELGGEAAFDGLVTAAHALDMRVVVTVVLNHTDAEHPWFQAALADTGGNAGDRDRYRFTTGPTPDCADRNPPQIDPYVGSRWATRSGATYYHRFAETSPDLNLTHGPTWEAAKDAVVSWLERGADGIFVPHPYAWVEDESDCEDTPASLALLAELRALVAGHEGAVLLAGARQPDYERAGDLGRAVKYTGGSSDAKAHAVLVPDLGLGLQQILTGEFPAASLAAMADELRGRLATKAGAAAVAPLGHWDMPRLSQAVSNDDGAVKLLLAFHLLNDATPWLFYGDEIGIGPGTETVVDFRDVAVPPMPWEATAPGLGFTTGEPYREPPGLLPSRAVDSQAGDEGSILAESRRLIELRNRIPALHAAPATPVAAVDASAGSQVPRVVAFQRSHTAGTVVAVFNFSLNDDRTLELNLNDTGWATGERLVDLLNPDAGLAAYGGPGSGAYRLQIPRVGARLLAPAEITAPAAAAPEEG